MSNRTDTSNLDDSLGELRAVRNLAAIASSIETFLAGQIDKVESSLSRCQQAFTQHQLLQDRILEFENKKAAWDAAQKLETKRLFAVGEKLIAGWEQLEKERLELKQDNNAGDQPEGQ